MPRTRIDSFRAIASLGKVVVVALVTAVLALLAVLSPSLAKAATPWIPGTSAPAAARGDMRAVPGIAFVENAGQFDPTVRFVARTFAGAVAVTESGDIQYALMGLGGTANGATSSVATLASYKSIDSGAAMRATESTGAVFHESFVNGHALPNAGVPTPTRIARYVGDQVGNGPAVARTYEHVMLGEVFPGVDVRLRATGDNVEKIFTVAAHQDPGRIRMSIAGARRLSLAEDGRLVVQLPGGEVSFTRPVAYQMIDGRRVAVVAAYALAARGTGYGFALGDYDHGRPLVIDPLLSTSYLGGSSAETITAVAVHPATGDVIVAGHTVSPEFPCGVNGCFGVNRFANGAFDAFVARYDAGLSRLLQVTFIGGSGNDRINALAIHPATGEVIVAGTTESTDLPCTTARTGCAEAGQPALATGPDGFVARLDPTAARLLQISYLGGNGGDAINAVTVHPVTGEIIVAGDTASTNLPCTGQSDGCSAGPQPALAGGVDGFVARFNSTLTTLQRATYLGGTSVDQLWSVAVHPVSGEIYVAGQTQSSDLPCTTPTALCAQAAQPGLGGGLDGFVARFSPNLGRLLQTSYVGGPAADNVFTLAIDPRSGDALVAGATGNTALACTTFAAGCANGAQSANAGGESGFVMRLNAALTRRIQATYLGGSAFDSINALVVHPRTGEVIVAGITQSTDFPCTGGGCAAGAQSRSGGGQDGFVARLDGSLTRLLQATYFGGAGDEELAALAVHPQTGEVLVAGDTTSRNLPCTGATGCIGGMASAFGGGVTDAFVARVSPDLTAADATPEAFEFPIDANATPSTQRTSSPVRIAGLSAPAPAYVDGPFGAAYCVSSSAGCGCDVTGGFITAPGTVASGQFVCVRHVAPPIPDAIARTVFHAGGGASAFESVTGPVGVPGSIATGCSLDIDGNGVLDALTDGLVLLRAMLGLTGMAATQDAIGGGATRPDWTAIRAYLNASCGTAFGN